MAWLMQGDRVLASLEVPPDRRGRRRGLMGRGDFDGAMLLSPCRSVHTFGMKFVLDVAFLDKGNNVVSVVTVVPGRVVIRLRSRSVIEARAGAFERWGLEVGQELEVKS